MRVMGYGLLGAGALAAGLVAACGTNHSSAPFRELDSTTSTSTPFKASVAEHARRGATIRDAVERGDVPGAKEAARGLVDLVMTNEQPAANTRLGEMLESARRVAAARDRRDAAHAFADLAYRCGACHAAVGGPPSIHAEPPAAGAPGIAPAMRRHQWGAARLWEGLVAPSDEAWNSGAAVLADATFAFDGGSGKTATPELDALVASVHDLGTKAAAAKTPAARVEVYGALLDTCASCHQRLGGGGPTGTP